MNTSSEVCLGDECTFSGKGVLQSEFNSLRDVYALTALPRLIMPRICMFLGSAAFSSPADILYPRCDGPFSVKGRQCWTANVLVRRRGQWHLETPVFLVIRRPIPVCSTSPGIATASIMAPGVLYVTMQPSPALPPAQFHDWYNNEHGPLRLRLSQSITNGFRYRALDLPKSSSEDTTDLDEWMAVYDLPQMSDLNEQSYLKLRSSPIQSTREQSLRPNLRINRQNFDLVREWKIEDFAPLETLSEDTKEDNIIIAATITLKSPGSLEAYEKWFADEHVVMLSKVPGWLRTRRFVTSSIDSSAPMKLLNINEFASSAALTSTELKAIATTPAAKDMMATHIKTAERRVWSRYYTFGPAPRDLAPLSNSETPSFESPASFSRLRTFPANGSASIPALESYITLSDDIRLPYRLEGSSNPAAPVIVLVNSILVNWSIWDSFVTAFFSSQANKQFRVLRYNPRGRYSDAASTKHLSIDLLAADLIALLDALRIPKAEAVVGVSLGGATALAAALTYPARISRFMSCDTSASAPAGNRKTWEERIRMSEHEGAARKTASASSAEQVVNGVELIQEGEAIVGAYLADATAKRWFPAPCWESTSPVLNDCQRVQAAVADNSLTGFKAGVQALWEYDYRDRMPSYEGKGMFLVGSEDGKLPESMEGMANNLGRDGTKLVVVEGCGHLPMVEKPGEVVKAVAELLAM
jgi:pimeloyl-ACP methyl ester carboxylesterase